jgi:isopentenyl diphosphate isomerase/L-lactate dehydrogenase-like FMN-dependent dehydrogenase
VLEILHTELEVAMKQCGVRSIAELSSAFVRRI